MRGDAFLPPPPSLERRQPGEVNVIRVAVTGVSGRMGSALLRFVREDEGMELVGATDRPGSPAIGLDAGLAARLGALEVEVHDDLRSILAAGPRQPQVVIDFTSAEASVRHAQACAEHGVALVVGSTGFSVEDKGQITRAATAVPTVMAPNMSVGVSLLLRLVGEAARVLGPGFDAEVLELHHRLKKDAPSGTALRLGEVVADAYAKAGVPQTVRTAREGAVGERPRSEIGIMGLRGGDVVGEHTVYFMGDGERLELTHRATSRDTFAAGAVRAAHWVVGKPAGLYDMLDVLGLR
jgi:4-hydroxy-tetrahydrodipicolinate reductase